ncbi:MAG: hypothetical protein HY316_07075 [Acidobacteria bacterium]|nr:hypothetical protein [Acidobacteriota bacterium]
MCLSHRLLNRLISGRLAALFALALVVSCISAQAQSHSHGYIFFAPGVASGGGNTNGALAGGVGAEGVFPGGVGLGAELGALKIRHRSGNGSFSSGGGFGLVSVGGYFHIPRSLSSVDSYLTAGYSALVALGLAASFFHIGGGVNWWFAPHFGLKMEFRDQARGSSGTTNIATFRFGLAFH